MLPMRAANDKPDHGLVDSVFVSQLRLGYAAACIPGANVSNVGVGEFCAAILGALRNVWSAAEDTERMQDVLRVRDVFEVVEAVVVLDPVEVVYLNSLIGATDERPHNDAVNQVPLASPRAPKMDVAVAIEACPKKAPPRLIANVAERGDLVEPLPTDYWLPKFCVVHSDNVHKRRGVDNTGITSMSWRSGRLLPLRAA